MRIARRSQSVFSGAVGWVHFAAATALSLTLAAPAAAQVSLRTAVLQATERDGEVAALRQKVASRSIEIQAARDAYYPSISVSGDTSTTDSDGPGITVTVSQVLFDWGLIRSKINAASHVRVQAVSELKMAVEGLTLQVAQYFIDVEVIDRKIERTRDYTAFAQRIADQAQARARAGIGDNGEVARAQLEIARAEDQLAQLVANRRIALSQIDFLVGRQVGSIVAPPDLGYGRRYAEAAKIRSAVRIAPDYIAARAGADEAAAGVEAARASRLPTIKLQAQGRAALNGGKSSAAIGLSTGVDLNSSGLGRRKIQSAELNLQAAKSTLVFTERQLTNTATSALQQISILRRTEKARAQQLLESQRVLDTYEQQFIGGQRELLDLLTTGRDLYDSEIEKIDTYEERKRTEYQAAHDLGVLGTLIINTAS
ncbi:outer membrane protein, adhesin transport system [Sulfitobacter dubius]|nr:outer membrane protein, adhesin transport system [Sulfitobacter dubius]